MNAPPELEKPRLRQWDSGRPRLAMAVSGGIHAVALMGFLVYHAIPPKKQAVVPIFEMVSLEPPKLRPLKPKSPEPPPEKVETKTPEAPKLTSKPEKTLAVNKPDPKVTKPVEDTTAPVKDVQDQTAELTTTIVANIPADPRLSRWAGVVKKRVEGLWNPPAGIEIQGGAKTVVQFQVGRDGVLSNVSISQPSGNAMLDELAERTIQRLEQVPPIPENFPEESLQVSYEFVYNGQ